MFAKILIANRGEIAVRIIRTCREMRIKTVAIYSGIDENSLHVLLADEAVKSDSRTCYLDMAWIISAALSCGAQAIHPGYGFLAENPVFAAKTQEAGLVFIGPDSRTIELMGDKAKARETMAACGVPLVPGGTEIAGSYEETLEMARAFGYPLLIKAVAGGGGRGMRLVLDEENFLSSLESARSEAKSCFGNSDVYLEKYLVGCRHVEIQVLADNYGEVVSLGERDCSIQRRHQKLIEESPSPALTPELRAEMCEVARTAAKAVHYSGAGTLEFLVDKDSNFYFIEMNTRIQVEHTVTEMVCGLDLIREQLRIASGEPLGYGQSEVNLTGWAMECRINAEDPVTFLPSPGRIEFFRPPGGYGVRVDSAAYSGYTVSPYYDSLIGKLVVYGQTREEVIARMQRSLAEFAIRGVKTTIPFHQRILADQDFQAGEFTTDFIQQKIDLDVESRIETPVDHPLDPDLDAEASSLLAATFSAVLGNYGNTKKEHYRIINIQAEDKRHSPYRLAVPGEGELQMRKLLVGINDQEYEVDIEEIMSDEAREVPVLPSYPHQVTHREGGKVFSPLPGIIAEVHVRIGDFVRADQTVVTLEAMKMENKVSAGKDGRVSKIRVRAGENVFAGDLLIVID